MGSEKFMNASRSHYGSPAKSKPRKQKKNPLIIFEELTKRYLPLIGAPAWGTFSIIFTYRNRKTNQCFPRYQTIADARGVSRRTVIRHVNILVDFGLIEKAPRFYDDDRRRECGGQRSNKYWFVHFSPYCVTPGMTAMNPLTGSSSNHLLQNKLEPEEKPKDNPCDHPWGEPLGYPHPGSWRCSTCGDIYTRKGGVK
jgi:hypothetical protein